MISPRRTLAALVAACALLALPAVALGTVTMGGSGGTTSYSVGDPAVTVDSGLSVSDDGQVPTAEYIDYVTVQVLYGSGGDTLSYPAGDYTCPSSNDILRVVQPNASSLIISLVDDGNVQGCTGAEWQARLRLVTFSASSGAGLRDVLFRAVSNSVPSDLATFTRNVNVSSPPQISLPSATLAYTEDAGAVALAPDATVAHPDGSNITGATVRVTGNYVSGQDVLALVSPPGGISATFDTGAGTLTLSGTASASTYQAALRGVTYANTANAPSTLARTVRFSVTDGSATATADMTVNVTAVNDAPQVVTSGGITTFTEGGSAVVVDSGLTLADADDLTLASATVSITANFASGQDVLAFTNDGSTMGNIAVSGFNTATGILTLTSAGATATKTQWRAALRAVTYANTSDAPSTANRTVSFQVNDGQASSAAATKTVAVVATNDAPVITTSGGTTAFTEGLGAVAVDSGITVSDADSGTLAWATVSISGNFSQGQDVLAFSNTNATAFGNIGGTYNDEVGFITLTSSGNTATPAQWQAALRAVTYNNTSVAPSTATRTVSIYMSDGVNVSNTATKLVSVSAVDNPPVVTTTAGVTAFTEDGGPVVVDSGVDAQDVDGVIASASVSITGNFASGQDVLALPTQAFDVTGSWNGSTGVLSITSGSALTRMQWIAALRAVTFDNTSQAPSTAQRTITFTVVDGAAQFGTAAKSVSVAGAADDPVVTMTGTTLVAAEGVATLIDTGLVVTDADVTGITAGQVSVSGALPGTGDVLAFTNDGSTMGNITGSYDAASRVLSMASAGGTATAAQWQAALRSVTYTNTSNTPDLGPRSIQVWVRDGDARPWVAATRALQVTAVNDAPSWTPITISIPMDDPWVFGSTTDLAFLYSDPEDDPLDQVKVTSVGAWGQVRDCNGPIALPATVSAANFLGSGPCPLRFVPVPGELGSNAIGLEVFDGQDWSGPQQLTLEATATPPSMAVDGGVITVPAGATVPVSGGLVLGPTLATGLPNGEVRVASGGAPGDALGISVDFALPGEIISIGNNPLALDLVSFANQATPAQWQAALRTVTFRAGSTPGTRTITFEVSNGLSASRASVVVQVPSPAPPAGDGGAAAPVALAPQGPAAVPGASIVRLTPAARARAAFSTAIGKAKVARTTALAACAKRPAASRAACRTAATRTYTRTVALATAVRTRDLALARCATRKGAARATCTKAAKARYARDRARASRR